MSSATSTSPDHTIVTARIETARLNAFRAIATSNHRSVSQELRLLIDQHIAEHSESGEAA